MSGECRRVSNPNRVVIKAFAFIADNIGEARRSFMLLGVATEIREAWLGGRYAAVISLLEAAPPDAARDLFLAQAYLRVARSEDALALLRASRDCGRLETPADCVRATTYESVACAVLGRTEDATSKIIAAVQNLTGIDDPQTTVEVQYNDAFVAWMVGDVDRASRIVGPFVAGVHREIDPSLLARFFMLRGWLFAAKERYVDQAGALMDAVACLEAAPQSDIGLLAWCAFPLAALIRDIYVPGAADLVFRLQEQLPWTEDLAMAHFQTLRAAAWALTLQGEYIRAFRKFGSATAMAPNAVAKMLVHLDHADCARFSGQHLVAAAQLAEADDLIRSHDWSTSAWEEARALIQAAELMARNDVQAAVGYLDLARSLKPQMARNAGYAHDRRLAAHADFAEAMIREQQSDRRMARHRAQRAYEVFSTIGYQWRAAQCALFLHRLDPTGEWIARAQTAVAPYPRSFVSQEILAAAKCNNPLDGLTSRQRDVLAGLCAGKTIDNISHDLNISPNTVRVHITNIHRLFRVERRSELLREVARFTSAA